MTFQQLDIFLATCLLESIEDENYSNTQKLLVDHQANPNLLLPQRDIAPIHYAAGMENTNFAEAAMKLILKHKGNPNVQTVDGETPLHIAAIWNRDIIVEMLLDHGADLTIKDSGNNTPINNAIIERHFNLIPIFQNYAFKDNEKTLETSEDGITKALSQLEITKQSGNYKNFNLKEASPLLMKMKCLKAAKEKLSTQPKEKEQSITEDDESIVVLSDDNDGVKKNLFQLTEENLERHLTMTPENDRKSLVNSWRNKVNKTHHRRSILPEDELDSFILKHRKLGKCTLRDIKNSLKSSSQTSETLVLETRRIEKLPSISNGINRLEQRSLSLKERESETTESFVTARNESKQILMKKGAYLGLGANQLETLTTNESPTKSEIILQTEEIYEHVDIENNIIFYENRLLTNPAKSISKNEINHNEINVLDTTSESGTRTEFTVPLSYNTDELRNELRALGDNPGPITKSTKRLYLKRLIRYKRKPQTLQNSRKGQVNSNFPIELQKTLGNSNESFEQIVQYAALESQMIQSFQMISDKQFREGNLKTSFVYLLIDPRISENLPAKSQHMPKHEAWQKFVHSIFYVGKGKSSRPYAHLYDAIKLYQDKRTRADVTRKCHESLKLDRIIEIWRTNRGVICLPVFHNIMPVEAYTREASIIDCLGVTNLTNIKRGDYYGASKNWAMRQRKQLGVLLLYKALNVFIAEGESQLRPDDIKKN